VSIQAFAAADQEIDCESLNESLLERFLDAKKIEGCSGKTISYYRSTLAAMFTKMPGMSAKRLTTSDLRMYLADYMKQAGKRTVDNVRRIMPSFFCWLEEENHIMKNPMKRIHKIKYAQVVKTTISDESMIKLRDNCATKRDLAIIDLLASSGMRVGELVRLDRSGIDFENRECVVFGKGDKERVAYFNAQAKVRIQDCLSEREDDNPALFVSLQRPHFRLEIPGVEIRLRELGKGLQIDDAHPRKFRRTMATQAIDKGMPIEKVQQLLGHNQIGATMAYAMVNQSNVKASHHKYIG
jgi:site-specific recombinase XerD